MLEGRYRGNTGASAAERKTSTTHGVQPSFRRDGDNVLIHKDHETPLGEPVLPGPVSEQVVHLCAGRWTEV